jgi:hypothetical protein
MEDFKELIAEEIRAVRENTDAIRESLAGQREITANLVKGHADHEKRLRKIEYFIATVIGALGLYKYFFPQPH